MSDQKNLKAGLDNFLLKYITFSHGNAASPNDVSALIEQQYPQSIPYTKSINETWKLMLITKAEQKLLIPIKDKKMF